MDQHINEPACSIPYSTSTGSFNSHKSGQNSIPKEGLDLLEAIEIGHSTDSENKTDNIEAQIDPEKAILQPDQANNDRAPPPILSVQDWDGPDDPENPHNWPTWQRASHVLAIALLSFAVTLGNSIIAPATDEIARAFHVSPTAAILPLTLYVVGLGLGPVLAAPLSEIVGRSRVYKLTPPIYLLLLGAGFAPTFGGLLACRFLASVAGSPVLAIGGGTVADLFPPASRAVALSTYIAAPFLGPAAGPVIGGFAAQYKGWRWTQWCLIFVGIAGWLACLPMRETYKKAILARRAKRLGVVTAATAASAQPVGGLAFVRMLFTVTLARPMHMLFCEPVVALFSVYSAFAFSVLFVFFAAFPYTFETVYGFNTWQSGLPFLGIGVGVVLAGLTFVICDVTIYRKKHAEAQRQGKTQVAPEHRLYAGMMGAIGLPIGLFWFAWTARNDIHWIVPTLAGIPFAWGMVSLFISAMMYCMDMYGPLNGASSIAANGFLRYTLGGCFPLFTLQMYTTLGIGWASSLLGFISVLLLPIPFLFFRFGPQIRSKSHYDTMKA